jgi:hypothetical protein
MLGAPRDRVSVPHSLDGERRRRDRERGGEEGPDERAKHAERFRFAGQG